MSTRKWNDTLIGYVFDDWHILAKQLTGKDWVDDSGAVDKFISAFEFEATYIGCAIVFHISSNLPWHQLDNGLENDGQSTYLDLADLNTDKVQQSLCKLKEKLEAAGLNPDIGPVLVRVDEWD